MNSYQVAIKRNDTGSLSVVSIRLTLLSELKITLTNSGVQWLAIVT